MDSLTERQERVLRRIVDFAAREERPPTTRELAADLGCHPKTVYQYVLALERKGAIERRKGRMHVARAFRRAPGVPILGRIAAGAPLVCPEHVEGTLSVETLFGKEERVFALRIRGDSMTGAQIRDGDFVVVRQEAPVPDGEIAAVLVDGEATVKRVEQHGDRVRLVPENPAYEPIELDPSLDDVRVLGKVVGVVRLLE